MNNIRKVNPVNNTIDFCLAEYYPKAMKKQSELRKNKTTQTEADRLLAYANRMQKLIYTAKHTDNENLVIAYTKDLQLLVTSMNSIYAEA